MPDICGSTAVVELSVVAARRSEGQRRDRDAHTFCRPFSTRVPASLEIIGSTAGVTATLRLRQLGESGGDGREVVCSYAVPPGKRQPAGPLPLRNCDKSVRAGDVVVADRFELEVDANGRSDGETTVRARLTDGSPPASGATRQFLGATPELAGVVLEVDAGAFPPFSGVGLREGPPLEVGDYMETVPGGRIVVGPAVEVTGSGPFPDGAVRLTVPYDAATLAPLPAGTLATLRLVRTFGVAGPLESRDEDDVAGGATDETGHTVQVGLSLPGNYYPSVSDLTPIINNGGPVMNKGVTVNIVWVGDFDAKPAQDPRPAIRTFLRAVGSTEYYRILETYGIDDRRVTLGGEYYIADPAVLMEPSLFGAQDAVAEALAKAGWSADPDAFYLVLGAPGVPEISRSGTYCLSYCGWHTWFAPAGSPRLKYAFVGHPDTCGGWGYMGPHGASIDSMISCIAHELTETVTDPEITAWHGVHRDGSYAGAEVADKCGRQYPGIQRQSDGAFYNVEAGGERFLVQALWANHEGGYCAMALENMSLEVVGQPVGGMYTNQVGKITVRLTNNGAAAIDSGALSVTWQASGLLAGDPVATRVWKLIPPGGQVDVDVLVQAPYEVAGNAQDVTFTFGLVDPPNNGHVFPATASTTIQVRRAELLYDQSKCLSLTVPESVSQGQQFDATAIFKNEGTTIWLAGQYAVVPMPLGLVYPGSGLPAVLAKDVAPGQELTVKFKRFAPGGLTEPDSLSVSVAVTNGASAFQAGCGASTQVLCAAHYGESCGTCGTVNCGGDCVDTPPANLGQPCGTCGHIDCSRQCANQNPPPNYGELCAFGPLLSCFGYIDCYGGCDIGDQGVFCT